MLSGMIQLDTGERQVNLWDLQRQNKKPDDIRKFKYHCKHCGKELTPRLGTIRNWYFAHKPPTTCAYLTEKAKEGPLHLQIKRSIAQTLSNRFKDEKPTVAFEERIEGAGRIADVLLKLHSGHQIAIEVQISSIPQEQIHQRTHAYSEAGVEVIWVFREWERKGSFQEEAMTWLVENGHQVILFKVDYHQETLS